MFSERFSEHGKRYYRRTPPPRYAVAFLVAEIPHLGCVIADCLEPLNDEDFPSWLMSFNPTLLRSSPLLLPPISLAGRPQYRIRCSRSSCCRPHLVPPDAATGLLFPNSTLAPFLAIAAADYPRTPLLVETFYDRALPQPKKPK